MSSSTLIQNVRIFDGVSVIAEHGHVLISTQSGRIEQISLQEPIEALAASCTVVDGTGCTLIPGLIDAHTHVFKDVILLETAIRYGVTTVFDLHNEPEWFQEISVVTKQRNDVSDVKSACFGATVSNGWPSAIVRLTSQDPNIEERISKWPNLTDQQSINEFIAQNRAAGASIVKLMQEDGCSINLPFPTRPVPTPSLEIQKMVVQTAHRNGMLAIAHALTNHSALRVLEAGADGLAHSSVEPVTDEMIQAFKKNNAFIIPTLAIVAACSGEEQEIREKFAQELKDADKEHLLGCLHITRDEYTIQNSFKQVATLKANGIDVICGTDTAADLVGTRGGTSVHQELWMYVHRCGFTPIEALTSATSKTADRFGLSDRGKIETGRLADVVLVKGDPTQNIEALSGIQGVWRNGESLNTI